MKTILKIFLLSLGLIIAYSPLLLGTLYDPIIKDGPTIGILWYVSIAWLYGIAVGICMAMPRKKKLIDLTGVDDIRLSEGKTQ